MRDVSRAFRQTTVMISSHDESIARMADRINRIEELGKIVRGGADYAF